MLERWTRRVLRARFAVLICWFAILGGGVYCATQLSPLLSNSFAVPGSDSERARVILARHFGERPDGTFTVVWRVLRPYDRALQRRLHARLVDLARTVPTGHAELVRPGGGVVYGDIGTRLDMQHAKRHTDDLRRALRAAHPNAYVTGLPAIQHDLDPIFAGDLRRGGEIAVPIAFLVLVALLGFSLSAVIPFVFAACTIAATLGAIYGIAHAVTMVTYVTNLVELIGLGLAVDYSLLIVYRFREELARGSAADDAVVRTMATAGRAVLFSGVAVAIGLALLLVMPVPLIRSMGIGGLLIPLMSIAAALTLQPVLLSLLGRRGVEPLRLGRRGPGRFWARLAAAIVRRPRSYLAAGCALLIVAAVPAFFLDLTPGSISMLPHSPESVRGFELLQKGVGPGVVAPTHVVVDSGATGQAVSGPTRAAVNRLADELFHDPEVLVVASGSRPPYVDASGRFARVIVAARNDYGEKPTQRLVDRLRHHLIPKARFPTGDRIYAGGAPPQGVDFLHRAYAVFPWLVLGVLLLTYAVLVRAFRSLILPLEAVLLNVLSIAAVYGLLVVAFRWGLGADLLGVRHAPQIEGWVPILLFAALFGLSMDYEVFLVSRIREAWDELHDNREAVVRGLERTGRIITSAAVIMVAAFAGFVFGRVAGLQEFGLGLALAVLVDATIVRVVLVPALMALVDRYNWWLPPGAARVVRVAPSSLGERARGA